MPSFSPTEAAFEGFRLTREHPRAVLAWVGAYFVFTLSLAVLTITWVGKDFAALQALSHQTNPDPTEMMRTFGKLAPFLMAAIPARGDPSSPCSTAPSTARCCVRSSPAWRSCAWAPMRCG